MILDEIVLHNFGVFRGRQSAVLTPVSAERNITLFGGLNGAGKTTLLEGLLLGLFGRHAPGLRGSGGYEDYLRKSVHRSAPTKEGARIEIRFRSVVDGEQRTYCVARSWTAPKSRVSEHLDVFVDSKHDQGLSDTWQERVEQFMPPSLAPLFFFDAERIERLADKEQTSQMLTTAIHALLGLDLVGTLQNDLVLLERRKAKEKAAEPAREAIESAEALYKESNQALSAATKSLNELRNSRATLDARLQELDRQYAQQGGSLAERKGALEAQAGEIAANLQQADHQLIDAAAGSLPLALVHPLLLEMRAQAGRESAARRAQLLTEVLESRDSRLLGALSEAEVGKSAEKAVRAFITAEQAQLAEDQSCEQVLDLSPTAEADLQVLLEVKLDDDAKNAHALLVDANGHVAQLEATEAQLASVPDAETLDELVEDRESARRELQRVEAKTRMQEQEVGALKAEADRHDRHLQKLHDEETAAHLQNQDSSRFVTHSIRLREVLGRFRSRLVTHHVERLQELILESYSSLIRKGTLLASVAIDPGTFELQLFTKEGHRLEPDRLSAGERQLLAVAMLWALARASGRPLPTAVDTPLGRLDATHRKNLVERYFPYASHQVLLFSTDEEIDEGLLGSLQRRIGLTYHLSYDDDTASTTIEKGYFW